MTMYWMEVSQEYALANIAVTQQLDTSGEFCPLPVIKAKQAIDKLGEGQVLKIVCTDPGSKADFPGWASMTGNTLLEAIEVDDKFIFYIRRGR